MAKPGLFAGFLSILAALFGAKEPRPTVARRPRIKTKSVEPVPPTMAQVVEDVPRPRKDRKITAQGNFGLFEITKTNNTALQDQNRMLTNRQAKKLDELGELMEIVREILGVPIDVHSGYRSPALNGSTKGSSKLSQHMRCEACDFSPAGPDTEASIEAAFDKLREAAKSGRLKFGQLIFESAARDYGRAVWLHISMGRPYRSARRCGEVKTMRDGKYTLVERIA